MKQVIAEHLGHEMTMITLDIPPGGGSAPHRHPGHHTFGYVLEGAYKIKLDNGPEKTLTKGQTFYEAPDQLHAVSRNGTDTEPAKVVLVVILAESGKPSTVPERP
jgi:quercetin dioxygenase-like cupin family protein